MIELNRVSRLIHKANFSARQRQAVNYGRKFVITDKHIYEAAKTVDEARSDKATENVDQIEKIVQPLNPEEDRQDRRILHEVTGIRYFRDEFMHESSSDTDQVDEEAIRDIEIPDYTNWYEDQSQLTVRLNSVQADESGYQNSD